VTRIANLVGPNLGHEHSLGLRASVRYDRAIRHWYTLLRRKDSVSL
jgi:hypothetical protein